MSGSLGDPDRLAALARTGLIQAGPQASLDRLSRLAARMLSAPISLVSLVDTTNQYFAGEVGLGLRQTPLSHSFCRQVVEDQAPLVVSDARTDPRVYDSPAIPDLGMIAYAGVPLTTPEGFTVGSLCVIENQPREWTEADVAMLEDLAQSVVTEIELRGANSALQSREAELSTILADRARAEAELQRERRELNDAQAVAEVGSWEYDPLHDPPTRWSAQLWRMLGLEPGAIIPSREALLDMVAEPDRERVCEELIRAHDTGQSWDGEFGMVAADGRELVVACHLSQSIDRSGRQTGTYGTIQDITLRAHRDIEERALRRLSELVAATLDTETVFIAVATEVQRLFGAHSAFVSRFDQATGIETVVSGARADDEPVERASKIPDGVVSIASVPVNVAGRLWGTLSAGFSTAVIPSDAEERLGRFSHLVSMAIANADAWERLSRQASTDVVTGLANRAAFEERLRTEVTRAERYRRALTLVLIDLDHFKAVNDTYGHPAGDSVLAEFGRRLTAGARDGELVARFGGEEFAWLMPETDAHGAWLAAERLRQIIESQPFAGAGAITASSGISVHRPGLHPADLVRRADDALYWAKERGRNATVLYPEGERGPR